MATKATDSCLQKAADDEPIFVLRAQDRLAPALVRQWAMQFAAHTARVVGTLSPQDEQEIARRAQKFDEAMTLADRMEDWPTRKLPD